MSVFLGTLSVDSAIDSLGSQQFSVPPSIYEEESALRKYRGKKVAIGIRPEDLLGGAQGVVSKSRYVGDIELVESLGAEPIVYLRTNVQALERVAQERVVFSRNGMTSGIGASTGVARVPSSTSAQVGRRLEMCLDVTQIQGV